MPPKLKSTVKALKCVALSWLVIYEKRMTYLDKGNNDRLDLNNNDFVLLFLL